MTAYLLAALDMAGTTVDEGGLVYSAVEAAVAAAVGGPVPADLMRRPSRGCWSCLRRYDGRGSGLRCRPGMPNRWRTRS